ncbi:MAG: amphi-Trp domain-containing protein [Phycisphaerae bacterium]
MRKREAKVKAVMELPKAISYLDDLVASLKAGRVTIENGAQDLSLTPDEAVKVEVKATQKPEKESISVELSWRRPDAVPSDVDLRITADEPAPEGAPSSPDRSS